MRGLAEWVAKVKHLSSLLESGKLGACFSSDHYDQAYGTVFRIDVCQRQGYPLSFFMEADYCELAGPCFFDQQRGLYSELEYIRQAKKIFFEYPCHKSKKKLRSNVIYLNIN